MKNRQSNVSNWKKLEKVKNYFYLLLFRHYSGRRLFDSKRFEPVSNRNLTAAAQFFENAVMKDHNSTFGIQFEFKYAKARTFPIVTFVKSHIVHYFDRSCAHKLF